MNHLIVFLDCENKIKLVSDSFFDFYKFYQKRNKV